MVVLRDGNPNSGSGESEAERGGEKMGCVERLESEDTTDKQRGAVARMYVLCDLALVRLRGRPARHSTGQPNKKKGSRGNKTSCGRVRFCQGQGRLCSGPSRQEGIEHRYMPTRVDLFLARYSWILDWGDKMGGRGNAVRVFETD